MLHVTLIPYTLHFRRPAATSRGLLNARAIWFVRAVESHHPDVVGWGECGPIAGLSMDDRPDFAHAAQRVCDELNSAGVTLQVMGHHPSHQAVAELLGEFADALESLPSLAFGLETALIDLAQGGKHLLWETPFARGERGLATHGLIWMAAPEEMLHQIDKKVARGHRVIKMKVGSLPFEQECDLLAEVRRRFTPAQVELRLDANGAFALDEAQEKLTILARFHIAFVEQPIPPGHIRQMAKLCQRSPIPVALDEEIIGLAAGERRDLLEAIRPQHIILKPALLGGFAACQAWSEECERVGCQWWVNSLLESNVGLNAICQWTAAFGGERVHGLGTGQLFTNNITSPLHYVGCELQIDASSGWSSM